MNLTARGMATGNTIYEDLCRRIERLDYMPGEKLSENELAREYGATRYMVRDALTRLKARRLIEVYPQRGTFVSLIDLGYVADIVFLREAMEQEAMKRIIESGDVAAVCGKMRHFIEEQKKCRTAEAYSEAFYEMDNAFHKCLYEEIGRESVISFIEEPNIHFRRWRNFELKYSERVKALIEEHTALVDAIERRDADEARTRLHEHLETVSRYARSVREEERQYLAYIPGKAVS